ncbi:MAG: hypothetical protein NT169_23660 [Chloroflexi bacterium]|nr:hypothetical protein [Chloroflexota bacterium]
MDTEGRILLVDRHPEWLRFASEVLREQYEVITARSFEEANECCMREGQSKEFDLIFIGLDVAASNLPAIAQLTRIPLDGWRFVVMFPVFQEDETLRMFFKAGVLDCADKPYESKGLLTLVHDELLLAKRLSGAKKFMRSRKTSQMSLLDLERILDIEAIHN